MSSGQGWIFGLVEYLNIRELNTVGSYIDSLKLIIETFKIQCEMRLNISHISSIKSQKFQRYKSKLSGGIFE